MNASRTYKFASFAAMVLVAAFCAGCSISVDKNKDGGDKNVKIETPMGGLHVSSDTTTAADVGLPVYPGAKISAQKDGDKSADIHFGFGDWQFRLKVVKYQTSDPPDQVLAFYKKALGRYGDVIQCSGRTPVGQPTVTHEGLTCDEDVNTQHKVDVDMTQSLKAGSKHRQHIMGIEKNYGTGSVFSLVELDLPIGTENGKAESN